MCHKKTVKLLSLPKYQLFMNYQPFMKDMSYSQLKENNYIE